MKMSKSKMKGKSGEKSHMTKDKVEDMKIMKSAMKKKK